MKFLCICYHDTRLHENLSREDLDALRRSGDSWSRALRRSGRLVITASLPSESPESWRSVRTSQGAPAISDTPYHWSRDQPGAFFVVDAASIDEAVDLAMQHPRALLAARIGGGLEVRACEDFVPIAEPCDAGAVSTADVDSALRGSTMR